MQIALARSNFSPPNGLLAGPGGLVIRTIIRIAGITIWFTWDTKILVTSADPQRNSHEGFHADINSASLTHPNV